MAALLRRRCHHVEIHGLFVETPSGEIAYSPPKATDADCLNRVNYHGGKNVFLDERPPHGLCEAFRGAFPQSFLEPSNTAQAAKQRLNVRPGAPLIRRR
jgi:hypothetical protein